MRIRRAERGERERRSLATKCHLAPVEGEDLSAWADIRCHCLLSQTQERMRVQYRTENEPINNVERENFAGRYGRVTMDRWNPDTKSRVSRNKHFLEVKTCASVFLGYNRKIPRK